MKKTDPKIKREMTRLFNKFIRKMKDRPVDTYYGEPSEIVRSVYKDFQEWLKKEEKKNEKNKS